jgi:hypothetical protein
MEERSIDVYLNDHLGGATLGTDLAEEIEELNEGTPLGELMASLSVEIEEDRKVLVDLMERLDVSKNPVKQATGWLAEKAGRVKFSGLTSGDRELGTFLALESLTLGVRGKWCMWRALKDVEGEYDELGTMDLDALMARADAQFATLERERAAAGRRALANEVAAARD